MEEIKTNSQSPEQGDDKDSKLSTPAKVGIGIAVVVGIALLVLVVILLLNHPETTETLRDLFIILLALETFVVGALLVILIYQLIALTRMLRDDLKPIIESAQETVNTAKGTAAFVSQQVTQPAIETLSYVQGIARSIGVLRQMLPRRKRAAPAPGEAGEGD
jgi:hypothetical protein